jgi:hypothetical protein
MPVFTECLATFELTENLLTCALGIDHDGDHWDPQGVYWREYHPPQVLLG